MMDDLSNEGNFIPSHLSSNSDNLIEVMGARISQALNSFADGVGIPVELQRSCGSSFGSIGLVARLKNEISALDLDVDLQCQKERENFQRLCASAPRVPVKIMEMYSETSFMFGLTFYAEFERDDARGLMILGAILGSAMFLLGFLAGNDGSRRDETIDFAKLFAEEQSKRNRMAARARLEKNGQRAAMDQVRSYFERWKENPSLYSGAKAFAEDMLEKSNGALINDGSIKNKISEWGGSPSRRGKNKPAR